MTRVSVRDMQVMKVYGEFILSVPWGTHFEMHRHVVYPAHMGCFIGFQAFQKTEAQFVMNSVMKVC